MTNEMNSPGGVSEVTIDNLMRQSPAYLSAGSYRHLNGVAIISAIAASQTPETASAYLLSRYEAGLKNYSTPPTTSSHSSILDSTLTLLAGLRAEKEVRPLVHSITNTVVQNDCANLTLALGGSPIMSASPEEAVELGKILSSLLINYGTLTTSQREAFEVAGKEANKNGKPVILDPVACGATTLRREGVKGEKNDSSKGKRLIF